MAKHESTAINDLIHVTQGRLPEPGGPDPADGLFVTKPPPPAQFLPVASYFDPGALTTPVPLVSAPPPPLPRRRAPNATPPVVPIHHDDEDDDEETQLDPNVMAKFAAASPAPLPFAAPMPPKPILPHYAIPSPVPLPPAPSVPSHARSTMVANPVPYPSVTALAPAPYIVSAPSGSAVAAQGGVAHDTLETHRVAPLALGDAPSSHGELIAIAKKLALPFAGVVVVLVFITGYVIHRGQGRASRESAPVAMPASSPSVAVAAAAAPVVAPTAAPVVTAIADAAPPTVSAMGDTIGWKPREVTPTLAKATEAAAPAVEEPAEIEMDAVPVVKQPRARRSSSSSKRPAAKQVAAAVPAAKAEKKPAKAENAARPVKVASVAKSAAAPVDDDPIAAAINAPTKSKGAKATGPGRVTITSTPAALIYVDGRSLNKMTPQTLTLPEGPHKITLLELSSRKAKTSEITVEAGGSAQIAKKF